MPAGRMKPYKAHAHKWKTLHQARRSPAWQTMMKRTTKKGAYKKNKVKGIKRRLAPIIETKHRELAQIAAPFGDTSGQIANPMVYNPLLSSTLLPPGTSNAIPSTGVYSLLTLANYYTQFQVGQRVGVDNDDRINGSNTFSKYLNIKGTVRFPAAENIQNTPQTLELIWGYCPAINATTTTAPAITGLSPASIYQHITQQVSEYMNSQSDQLRFHPRRDQSCQILGRRKVRPNLQKQYSVPPTTVHHTTGADVVTGVVPDWNFNVSFKMMRKTHFDKGGVISYVDDAGNTIDEQTFNLNDHRIPFVCFYQPDYGIIGGGYPEADMVPHVAYNSMYYMNDA